MSEWVCVSIPLAVDTETSVMAPVAQLLGAFGVLFVACWVGLREPRPR